MSGSHSAGLKLKVALIKWESRGRLDICKVSEQVTVSLIRLQYSPQTLALSMVKVSKWTYDGSLLVVPSIYIARIF